MDDRASGTMIGFIVALGVAGVLMVGLLSQSDDARPISDDNPVSDKVLEEKAVSLSRLLLESRGHTSVAGQDWVKHADDVQRLGLRNATGSEVDFYKLLNLRLAKFEADDTDGRVNYEEARAGLGLDTQGLDVHIRAKPRLRSLDELLANDDRDEHLRVGYIGNAIGASEAGSGAELQTLTCEGINDSILYRLVVKNTGITITQFTAILDVKAGSAKLSETINGVKVGPGASTELYALIPATSPSLCSATATASVALYDPEVNVGSKDFTLVGPTTAPTTAPADLSLDTTRPYFLTTEDVGLAFDSDKLKNSANVSLTVTDATNAVVYSELGFALGAPSSRERNIGMLPEGIYDATLSNGTTVTSERIVVSATSIAAFSKTASGGTWNWHAAVPTEVAQVEKIIGNFCPYEHNDPAASPLDPAPEPDYYTTRCTHLTSPLEGSVIPDIKRTMNDDLPLYLLDGAGEPDYTHFTVLVVGSEVDHNAMTSASAKHAIRDWVYGGGTLVVFGSAEQSVTWLQPIFHAAIQSSSGGIATPDNLHPVLHTPDPLDWDEYSAGDRAWVFNAGAGDHFTNVVTQDDGAILALSDPGDFQLGNVYLTTWQPYDIYKDGTPDDEAINEGMKLIHNIFMMGYRDLYLDYGPPIPSDATVMTAQSLRTVVHPQLGEKPLAFTVYVFRST